MPKKPHDAHLQVRINPSYTALGKTAGKTVRLPYRNPLPHKFHLQHPLLEKSTYSRSSQQNSDSFPHCACTGFRKLIPYCSYSYYKDQTGRHTGAIKYTHYLPPEVPYHMLSATP